MIKRFARIYPLHLTMLFIFLLMAFAGNNPVHGFFVSVFLVHAWGLTENLTLNGPSWTLSAEMFAYFLFSIFAVRKLPTLGIAIAFAVTAVCVHLFALKLGHAGFLHLTWDFGSLRILPLFILGMLLRRLTPLVTPVAASAMVATGIVLLFYQTGSGPVEYEILIPLSLLIVGGARLSDVAALPTNSRLLVYLGEISYSIYLTHILVITIFVDYLPKLGLPILPWPVIGLALILGSSATYQLIEVPARRWLNQFAKPQSATDIS
jgi:peptidoglycan/LPS O-acetylase OafA/YrhL